MLLLLLFCYNHLLLLKVRSIDSVTRRVLSVWFREFIFKLSFVFVTV